jgi:PIN domain nuclease of toxin-antitoxin system
MNIVAVADTHAALWHLYDDPRLSVGAGAFIDAATLGRHAIAVSTISLVEVAYLIEKKRAPASAYDVLALALADPEHVFIEMPLSAAIADTLRRVSRLEIPDMPDRIIAATALHLAVPVISRDGRIRSSALETIW